MHFGKFGKISLNIPWKQNFSVPTEITLENVEIVLSMLKQSEWEFLDLISEHLPNEEIAKRLNLSKRTVENYVSRIFDKFNVENRYELEKLL